ncbi:Hypothetical predicted protein [Octopus vulgaris]|uniref:Period circadian-like C-terminal domain-containing protein n=1 Tax=Octopus vulgaris TaxID=6645 RepID=A0AA36AQB2_OCTVU|nr:Hypothetical predicted protein [Octopus vulgaris]
MKLFCDSIFLSVIFVFIFRGSSSSVSISLSSETTDDQPSTSGCSSMHVTGNEFRQIKKEKVKAYIQQIKSMLPPSKGRGKKTGTLSALQHVIDKLKKLKENKDDSKFSFEDSATDSVDHCSSTGTVSKEAEEELRPGSFVLAVTLDCRVDSVHASLLKFLGYPKDSWRGHLLTSFTSRKDIITVNNMLSKNENTFKRYADSGGAAKQKENTIYFRLRYYKNLNDGYGLKRQDKFCAFQANVTTQILDTPSSEKDRNILGSSKKTKHFILRCVPLQSAYIGCSMPKDFTFSTTHNLYCNLSLISNSAITLLGFLPQDLIGMSIFELYHPDDLTYLQTVYQKVVSTQGFRFKSEPYRLRTRNQSWVYVETEWSATLNQWSKRLEDVNGQHTVVRIPENPNVFDEDTNNSYSKLSEESQIQGQKLQRMIQEILLQQTTEKSFLVPARNKPLSKQKPAVAKSPPSLVVNISTTKTCRSEVQSKEGFMTAGSFVDDVIYCPNDGNVSPAVSHSSSPPLQFDSDTSVTYEQLNYSYNIRRFLLSQPKTYHSDNSDKEDSKQVKSENCSDFCADTDFVPVDIPILNPPSFGSSTKVLVSDQEPRDATSPPADDYLEDFNIHKELSISTAPPSVSFDGQSLYQPVSLTPEVLRMHTQLQERLYVQQATSDSSLFELDRGRSSDNSSNRNTTQHPNRHKLSSSDQEDYPPSKVPRLDQSQIYPTNMQQAQMTNQQLSSSQVFNKTPLHPQFYRPTYPVNMPYSKYPTQVQFPNVQNAFQQNFQQAIPVLQYDPAMHMTSNNSTHNVSSMNYTQNTTTASMPTTYWPCYTQTGMPFVATQLVGRFYQSVPGLFHAFNTPVPYSHNTANLTKSKSQETKITSSSGPNTNRKESMMSSRNLQGALSKHNLKISESSCSTTSQEETSSSLMYLLETGSCNTSSPCPDIFSDPGSVRKNKRLPRDPFWLQNTNWSTNIRMKYTVPHKSLKHLLKEDNERLNTLYQSKVVQEQLKDLKVTINSNIPVINEEEDFLVFFENSTQLNEDDKSEKDQECDESAVADSPQSSNSASTEEETEIIVFEARDVKDKNVPNEKTEAKTESGKDKEQQNSEKTESSDNDDDNSESSSKNSSYLTTSDQRSNEEAGSSLKESDGASKESDSGSKESDNGSGEESKPTLMEKADYNCFSELFVPLSLRVPKRETDNRPSKQPHWLMKADFNENIKMGYHISSKELDSILESDSRRMVNLTQSSMVHEQLQTLLGEIEDTNSLDAETTAATYDYSESEKLMDTVPSTPTSTTAITFSTIGSATTTSATTTTTNCLTENQEMACSPSESLSPVNLSLAPTKTDDVTMSPVDQNDLNANSSSTENITTNKDNNSESQSDETTDDVLMPLASSPSSSSSYSLHSPSNIVNSRVSSSYAIPMIVNSSEMPSPDNKFVSQLEQKAANNCRNVDVFDKLFLSTVTEEDDFI